MITKVSKISKRIAITLLIALFSIAAIVACSGENITGSAQASESPTGPATLEPIPDPDPTGEPIFPEDSFYEVYAPFASPQASYFEVSYLDTESLTQLWRKQIEGGKDNDGKRFIIRDANNNQSDPLTGSYYYFDNNLNIVYYRQGKGSLTVRKFLGGVIAKYRNGKYSGIYAIGGIYETVLSKNEITGNNFDQLNIFMGHEDMRATSGGLEVLTINTGYAFDNNTEFGVDFYYNKSVIGANQLEQYTDKDPEALSKFMSGGRYLSFDPGYVNFKFVSAEPQGWHLSDHLSQQGWHE